MTWSQAVDETDAGALERAHSGLRAWKGGRMAHLFGLIALRTGISRPVPLFGDMNTQLSPHLVSESRVPPLSVIAVVTALQSELHHRRVSLLVAPPLRMLPFNSA